MSQDEICKIFHATIEEHLKKLREQRLKTTWSDEDTQRVDQLRSHAMDMTENIMRRLESNATAAGLDLSIATPKAPVNLGASVAELESLIARRRREEEQLRGKVLAMQRERTTSLLKKHEEQLLELSASRSELAAGEGNLLQRTARLTQEFLEAVDRIQGQMNSTKELFGRAELRGCTATATPVQGVEAVLAGAPHHLKRPLMGDTEDRELSEAISHQEKMARRMGRLLQPT